MRKQREIDSLHFLILSPFPPSLSISSFSLHFLHQNLLHFVTSCKIQHFCRECHKNLNIRAMRKKFWVEFAARKPRKLCRPAQIVPQIKSAKATSGQNQMSSHLQTHNLRVEGFPKHTPSKFSVKSWRGILATIRNNPPTKHGEPFRLIHSAQTNPATPISYLTKYLISHISNITYLKYLLSNIICYTEEKSSHTYSISHSSAHGDS